MERYHFIIHAERCIECYSCSAACYQEHCLTHGDQPRRTIQQRSGNKDQPVYLSMSCNHCQNPVCVTICPNNNYTKRRDGIVTHDDTFCEGCKLCVEACPFGAPQLNLHTEKVDKCDFCHERLSEGLAPVCVGNCPTDALNFAKLPEHQEVTESYTGNHIPISRFTSPAIVIRKQRAIKQHFLSGGLS
ncbi:4Fe-4S dicluster domain-containing protein [Salisediminibacterium beveridgei]|uniref:4Fe-4S dicluster domain-containing protein n=1 Tax=Salisediminibacterium beveridgei TaxID=632773 RepID=UPI000847EE9E|nr:4Fe-4S dicluster domain-containing protein [Salisediminibacterium beveridgei]